MVDAVCFCISNIYGKINIITENKGTTIPVVTLNAVNDTESLIAGIEKKGLRVNKFARFTMEPEDGLNNEIHFLLIVSIPADFGRGIYIRTIKEVAESICIDQRKSFVRLISELIVSGEFVAFETELDSVIQCIRQYKKQGPEM